MTVSHHNCPACQSRLADQNSICICPICREQYCKKCEMDGRVCPNCGPVVPPDILQKYRIWDVILPLVIYIIALICISFAIYIAPPWPIIPWEQVWTDATSSFILIALFLIFSIFAINIGKLGKKRFQKWVANPTQRAVIIEAMEAQLAGRYESSNMLYQKKMHFWKWLNKTNYRLLLILTVIFNVVWAVAWIFRFIPEFDKLSVAAGVIASIAICLNFIILILAYSQKSKWGAKPDLKHLIIRGLLAFCIISTILSYGGFIYYILVFGGIFPGPSDFVAFLRGFMEIGIVVVHGTFFILEILMLVTQNFSIFKDDELKNDNRPNFLYSISKFFYRFSRPVISIILFLWFGVAIALTIYIAIGDVFMMFTYFNLSAIVGLYIPLMIGFMALIKKHPQKGHKQFFWTIAQVFGLLIVINLVPIVHTTMVTNPELDSQFATVFGANWEQQLTEEEQLRFKPYRYSIWDNLYGYNFSLNAQFNTSYTTDIPYLISGNTTTRIDTFYFDAYLPSWVQFGDGSDIRLPVLILMHGEYEDFGPWNANMSSQVIANMGYLVCDMNYGYLSQNIRGMNFTGYTIRQVVEQFGRFTKFLSANNAYYHANLNETYFSGRHLGGTYALICGFGYNKTLQGVFAPEMNVRGIIPYYPLSDIGTDTTGLYTLFLGRGTPFMNGSSDPSNATYDSDWININPALMIDNLISPRGSLAPVLFFTGTHDYLITMPYSEKFISKMHDNGHTIITGYHLLGSDGYDGAYFNVWGQSCLYYMLRFMALTN